MIISSYQSFINFIGNDFVPNTENLKNCVAQLNTICNCQKSRKSKKSEECNQIYIDTINSISENITDYLLSKTNDESVIFCHNGSHEIKKIKLR